MGRFTGVILGLIVLAAACGGDDDVNPSPTSTASTSPTSSATSPTPTTAPAVGDLLTRGPEVDFPDDVAMIIESGCWGCDGGPAGLWRYYRDPTGTVRKEDLLEGASGLPADYSHVSAHKMTNDGSVLGLSLCITGTCRFTGLGDFDPSSQGIAYRSLDGGITWQEIGRGGPVYEVAAVLANGQVLVASADQDDGQSDYTLLPDNTPVIKPAGGQYPVVFANQIVWATDVGSLINPDSSLFFEPPDGGQAYYNSNVGYLASPGKGSALLFWNIPIPGSGARPDGYIDRWGIAEVDIAEGSATITRQWEIDGYLWTIGSWSSKNDTAIVSFYPEESEFGSPLPAVVNFITGTYSLIPGPFKSDQGGGYSSLGRTGVRAVQTGPFARVTGTGSCLNLRTEPDPAASVLTCAADDVLLRDGGDSQQSSGGDTWISVMTPGGIQGWANAAFLER